MSTTPDYGEPWRESKIWDCITDREGIILVHTASEFNDPFRTRAITCVNACAGMADPAAEIAAMREAIREAHEAFILGENPLPKLRPFIKP